MNEQELLNMFIQERIDMLLTKFNKTRPTKSDQKHQRILDVELVIDALPDTERELVQEYIERFSDRLALEEPYLYQQGFIDAIRVINYFIKL